MTATLLRTRAAVFAPLSLLPIVAALLAACGGAEVVPLAPPPPVAQPPSSDTSADMGEAKDRLIQRVDQCVIAWTDACNSLRASLPGQCPAASDPDCAKMQQALEKAWQVDLFKHVNACVEKWQAGCDTILDTVSNHCPFPAAVCTLGRDRLEGTQGWTLCQEGSIAECQAACDAARPYACMVLANVYHAGVRAPKDVARADMILEKACDGGRIEACTQRAFWLKDSDPTKAAELAMRACASEHPDERAYGCTLWMVLLEGQAYAPPRDERVSGLQAVCRSESANEVLPGKPVSTQTLTIHYQSGACGRLKDMGMSP